MRALDALEPVALATVSSEIFSPFFSSDGQWVGFFTGSSSELQGRDHGRWSDEDRAVDGIRRDSKRNYGLCSRGLPSLKLGPSV